MILMVQFFFVMNRLFTNLRVKRVIEEVESHPLLLSVPRPQALWSSQGLGLMSACRTSFSSSSAFIHWWFGSLLSLTSQCISYCPPLSWNENGWSPRLFCNSKVLGSLVLDQISHFVQRLRSYSHQLVQEFGSTFLSWFCPLGFCPWILLPVAGCAWLCLNTDSTEQSQT